ncbi:MAG: DEAD/DEAH box helicase [Hyphomicrobiaceae bacterium]|nr:DEAD/DEAH box helicase [Hyphomicrobiaceae bacterium]MCC0008487.1 DEAD/DEAH box helicase [Hyphomicrobiaceae bacterium]
MTITFSDLGLAEPVLKALAEEGYVTPTPIQAQAIPPLLKGADLLGIAQTGTGKTAAFALPLLTRIAADQKFAPRRSARVLVLSPTRELAAQIGASFRTYGRHLGIRVAVVFGGVSHKPQIDALAGGVEVLVATPGRLIDHLETRMVNLDAVEALVLDEADQMLDLGFVRPIRRIVSKLRARRQNLFFSATMPHEIAALAAELLHDPVRVQVTPVATTAERVSQRVIQIEAGKKRSLLVDLLAAPEMSRTLVFTRTKRGADRVARHLEEAGITAAAIHGNKSQRQREVALDAFRNAKIGVLVATDIAARGIDIDGVTHVVNYELPEVPEAYVHRIGRTARAGAEGSAVSLCDNEERDLLRAIERLIRQSIPSEDRRNDPSIAVVAGRPGEASRRGERQGERHHARKPAGRRGDRSEHRGERGDRGETNAARDGRGRPEKRRPHAAPAGNSRDGQRAESHASDASRNEKRRHNRGERQHGDAVAADARGRSHGAPHGASRRERHAMDPRDSGRSVDGAHRGRDRAQDGGRRQERAGNPERGGRADGQAVAHVFDNGFKSGGGKSAGRGGSRRHEGRSDGAPRRHGRDDVRNSERSPQGDRHRGKPAHGGPGGKRRSNGGKGHRGAHAGRPLVDA